MTAFHLASAPSTLVAPPSALVVQFSALGPRPSALVVQFSDLGRRPSALFVSPRPSALGVRCTSHA